MANYMTSAIDWSAFLHPHADACAVARRTADDAPLEYLRYPDGRIVAYTMQSSAECVALALRIVVPFPPEVPA